MKNDDGIGQFSSGESDGMWSEPGFILKIEPIGFYDRLNDVEHKKKKKSKMTPKFLAWITGRMNLTLMDTRKTTGGIDLEKEIKSLGLYILSVR